MTSNRTLKTSTCRTLIVAATLAGSAWIGNAYAEDSVRTASAAQTASATPAAPKTGEPSFDLRDYGDRFKLAIEEIRKEHGKPDWTWDNSSENGRVARQK